MIEAADAVVWVEDDMKLVMVRTHRWGVPEEHKIAGHWTDPIGAAYSQWQTMTNQQRVQLMLETVIDLAAQDYPIKSVLKELATIKEFRELGSQSYPMCRALTSAMVGRCLEANTMTFEELLVSYRPTV